MIFKMLKKNWL